jgi:putative dimethyl sulfoxide reductase chaperone
MSAIESASVERAAAPDIAARSSMYLLLSCAFAYPEGLDRAVADGGLRQALERWRASLPYSLPAAPAPLADPAVTAADLEAEYIRLFDVGAGGPPCPLYGGVYQGDRMRTMEEATRFYHFFGLHLAPPLRELPDHLSTELEFMHYLTYREAEARQQGTDPAPLLRAERDFLARHPCRWLPRLAERLARQEARPFYPALVAFSLGFLAAEEEYTAARAEAA